MRIKGRWRIVEMELWDHEAIDLLGPAFIEIKADGDGTFRFIAVEGWMDIRDVEREGTPAIEFSWGRQRRVQPREWPRLGGGDRGRIPPWSHLLPHGGRFEFRGGADAGG
jgi:hypothetical protein